MGGTRLTTFAIITFGVCLLGIAGAILAGTRRGTPVTGLLLLFAGGAVYQGLLLLRSLRADAGSGEATYAVGSAAALLVAAVGGLVALRSARRTVRERDRAEDLHWDSMEVVRAMGELTARPGADLDGKLGSLLELGASRFGLDVGIVWRRGGDAEARTRCDLVGTAEGDGTVLALRAPDGSADADAIVEALLPRLRDAAKATRPVKLVDSESPMRELFGASLRIEGEAQGALAFAGSGTAHRLTATDKDLCALMAQWLSFEVLDRAEPARPQADRNAAPVPHAEPRESPRPRLARRNLDLNDTVRRLEPALRRRVGVDATLEIDLGASLPRARSGRLPLATLVESLVAAAAVLAPTGRIRIETSRVDGADGSGDLTLCVAVAGDEVGSGALERLFAEHPDANGAEPAQGPVALARLERLLRREGGDLSAAVEPRRRAAITAYLPAGAQRTTAGAFGSRQSP